MSTAIEIGPASGVFEDVPVRADAEVRESLDVLSDLYNYNHWLYNKIRPFICGRVCEIGCGIGNITQFLLNHPEVVGVEPSSASCCAAQERFDAHANVRIVGRLLSDAPCTELSASHFDTVMCLNVLEHIEDDIDALSTMRKLCRTGGKIVILVPAHQGIYGGLDETLGHYRRYNKRSLLRAFEQSGIAVQRSFYLNAIGFFGWWWESRCLGRRELSREKARVFNRLVPFIDAMERIIPPPFGQSIVMVGTPANNIERVPVETCEETGIGENVETDDGVRS